MTIFLSSSRAQTNIKMIENFHFIRPLFLTLMPLGLLLTYALWIQLSRGSGWNKICDPHLLKHLLVGKHLKNSGFSFLGMALGWIVASLAMAGPAWERQPQPAHNIIEGRVLVFDLSRSMDSIDIQPTRLARARYKLMDLILAGEGLQQGLVVFAGDAFVVTPLTEDTDTLLNLIPSLNTNTVPVQGSRADLGLEYAATLLRNTGLSSGKIILVTDGVSSGTRKSAEEIASEGYQVSVMAVGTSAGGPVRYANGELLKDVAGNIVIPGVNFNQLQRVAEAGGGKFVVMAANDSDITGLTKTDIGPLGLNLEQSFDNFEPSRYKTDRWLDNGPWLVMPLLLIVAFGFRRGWILALFLVSLQLAPKQAIAFTWDDIWLRNDQRAARNFSQQKYDQIEDDAPMEWQGAAKFRSGDFIGAEEAYSAGDHPNAATHFNRGNALAHANALAESIAAYDRALDIDPGMEDAEFNKEIVERLLDQKNQQSSSREQNGQQSEQQENPRQDEPANQQASNQENYPQSSQNNQPDSDKETSEQLDSPEKQNTSNSEQQKQVETASENTKKQDSKPAESQFPMSEQQQALEQWLKRIPDDPGGLLRRKFAHQYSLRPAQKNSEQW